MHILVCNAQVPFVHGGAEMLADGLVAALNARGHTAELVALPYKWYPKNEIFKSALAWRLLDLTESNGVRIDRIIATKFPSYAAAHPHKVVWLVHQLRQAYDWYGTALSDFTPADQPLREQIFEMDRKTLSAAQARYAISKNVAARLSRFNGLEAEPLYPPPRLTGRFRSGDYGDYILYLGRLDRAKRVDLLLRGLARLKSGRAIIGGAGPEASNLKNFARSLGLDARVEFPGYVDDERALSLYANARAVYYAPVDEDYGFSTVEALLSCRPVITTGDAGGVLEFIEDGASGWVAAPDAESVSRSLASAFESGDACRQMGRAGAERVKGITWDNVVARLTA